MQSDDPNVVAMELRMFKDHIYELVEFRAEHGHCRIGNGHGTLSKWVKQIRTQYRKGILPDKRVKILVSLGFDWSRNTAHYERTADNDSKWNARFNELVEYKRQHGHTLVPQGSGELGRWVKMQREQKKTTERRHAGKDAPPPNKRPRPCIPPDRIAKLDSIQFSWEGSTRRGWDERFEELVQYKAQHHDCHVPQAYPENRALGRWVMKQRCWYNLKKQGKKSRLSDEKERKLEDIGFAWVAPGYNFTNRKKRKRSGVDGAEDEEKDNDDQDQDADDDIDKDPQQPAPIFQQAAVQQQQQHHHQQPQFFHHPHYHPHHHLQQQQQIAAHHFYAAAAHPRHHRHDNHRYL